MGSSNGENTNGTVLQAKNNFFAPDGFKPALMRCLKGHDEAAALTDFMNELAEFEASHAKALDRLILKWAQYLGKTDEHEIIRKLSHQTIEIVDAMAQSHHHFSVRLTHELVPKLRNWRKERYQKKGMLRYVIVDETEKKFMTLQNEWLAFEAKLKEMKMKHLAAKKTMCEAQFAEDKSLTEEQQRQRLKKLLIAEKEVQYSKEKCMQIRREMQKRRIQYEMEMTHVFNQLDQLEEERLDVFVEQFQDFGKLVRALIAENDTLQDMIHKCERTVTSYEPKKDLIWWNETFGPKNAQETRKPFSEDDSDE